MNIITPHTFPLVPTNITTNIITPHKYQLIRCTPLVDQRQPVPILTTTLNLCQLLYFTSHSCFLKQDDSSGPPF